MKGELSVSNLTISFQGPKGVADVVENARLEIPAGKKVALVGESGSGKTIVAKTILGLLPANASVRSGEVSFGDLPILRNGKQEAHSVRGKEIAMIFQNPKSSLNPIRKIGLQIEDVLRQHTRLSRGEIKPAVIAALASVRLPDPERIYHAYPFELSGGMAQRALISVALACNPSLLIADEPTTGLDVSLQREVMELIESISSQRGMSLLLITHDLAVAQEYCDSVVVMHAGHVVEKCPVKELLENARHPYTRALIRSTPNAIEHLSELRPIRGTLPDLYLPQPACRFIHRCGQRMPVCEAPPPIFYEQVAEDHSVLCRRPS